MVGRIIITPKKGLPGVIFSDSTRLTYKYAAVDAAKGLKKEDWIKFIPAKTTAICVKRFNKQPCPVIYVDFKQKKVARRRGTAV